MSFLRSRIRSFIQMAIALCVQSPTSPVIPTRMVIKREEDGVSPYIKADDYRTNPKLPLHVVQAHARLHKMSLKAQSKAQGAQGMHTRMGARSKRSMIAISRRELRESNTRTRKGRRNGSR